MANKVTVFPRPSRTKEPRELTIFALGDQRVVIDLRDGTSKFRTTAEVISIEQKRKPRRRRMRTTTRTHYVFSVPVRRRVHLAGAGTFPPTPRARAVPAHTAGTPRALGSPRKRGFA